jgi:hypothetical protein
MMFKRARINLLRLGALMGGRNEHSLDHHNWISGRGDREILSSWQQVRT